MAGWREPVAIFRPPARPALPARQRLRKLRGTLPPIRRQLGQRRQHRLLDRLGHRVPYPRGRRRPLGHHLGDDGLHRRPGEGRLSGQHLVADAAQGVDVGTGGDLAFAHCLLWRHVVGRPQREAGFRHPGAAGLGHRERDAEVGHQRPAIVQQDVLGLDVAVDDAVAVGVVQRRGDFSGQPHGVGNGQQLLACQPVPQRFALDEGHDVEEKGHRTKVEGRRMIRFALRPWTFDHSRIEEWQDMRMLQIRRGPDLRAGTARRRSPPPAPAAAP